MWLLIGLILGAGLLFLVAWLRVRGINIAWYEWLLGALGVVLIFFAVQNYLASVANFQPIAPGRFLLVFGCPGLILLVAAVFLIWLRHYLAGKKSNNAGEVKG